MGFWTSTKNPATAAKNDRRNAAKGKNLSDKEKMDILWQNFIEG